MKILIIEDEEALVKVLKEKFEKSDFDVKIATDGVMGVKTTKEFMPDLVLLDLVLPKKGGFEVLEEIKSDEETKQIPVIVLSNLGEDENIKKALSSGAIDYFAKAQHPINEIVEKVKEYLISGK